MAYKEPHLDKNAAKALSEALNKANEATDKVAKAAKKPPAGKKPAKK